MKEELALASCRKKPILFLHSLINETLSHQVSFERKVGWGKTVTQSSVTRLAHRSKALFQCLPFKEKYFIYTGFTPLQPKHLLHQQIAEEQLLFIKRRVSSIVSRKHEYSRQSVIFIVMATKIYSYTVVDCKTSKWQVILAVASTTGQNVINTSHTLVILTASYAHKPHDFSALTHWLAVTQYFNLHSYSF